VVGAPTTTRLARAGHLQKDATAALGTRVCFTGARADVPEILRSIDVMVNASDCEPFGRSVLEAQACGTPVGATSAGGIPEFVAPRLGRKPAQPSRRSAAALTACRIERSTQSGLTLACGGAWWKPSGGPTYGLLGLTKQDLV